jgi:signal transduction histidine kinase
VIVLEFPGRVIQWNREAEVVTGVSASEAQGKLVSKVFPVLAGEMGKVRLLRLRREEEMVCIEVQDNGPGMSENVSKRVFEPFYSTKGVGQGTGLGLSISYFIVVDHHQGTMEVESAPGKGTTFIMRLPLKRAS